MRFQVGDIIRISSTFLAMDGANHYPRGRDGEIERIEDDGTSYPIKVRFQDVIYGGVGLSVFNEREIKLVRRIR